MIIIILTIFTLLLIRYNRDLFYFHIRYNDIKLDSYPEIKIDNHYAIYYKNNKDNCLIISHGNAANIYYNKYIIDKLKYIYDGDIYCYEYPGFGKCKGKLTINGCVNEHLFWIDYLSKKYKNIDLWGYSIGGGILSKTIPKLSNNLSYKIRRIYFHNTFSNIKNVIEYNNTIGFFLYKILFINDLDTNNNFRDNFYKNKDIYILHALNDKLIPYNEAVINYNKCKQLNYNVKLIELDGDHVEYDIKYIQ